jgi:hypothetical protein
MKSLRLTLILFLTFAIAPFSIATVSARAQDPQEQNQATPLMRGYRTGYSDGYQAGIADTTSKTAREFQTKSEYERGDRAYNSNWGALDEYRDGYRQGFEVGYNAGYDRKSFDSSIPSDLRRRAQDDAPVQYPVDANKTITTTTNDPVIASVIPRDTILRIELLHNLSTDASQKGDPFQARVLDPKTLEGAVIDGHLEIVQRPGKAKGTAQLQLAFDQIKMPDGRISKFRAQVIEVIPNGSSQGVGKVDNEGGVKGTDSTKGDVQKVGTAAGVGAVIGLIFGGGSGAAIGASIGAGVGTAGVLNQRGKDIRLSQGQQLRIRTATDVEAQ